jgi:hypothetical protein
LRAALPSTYDVRRAFGIVLVVCVLCIASAPIEAASTAPKVFPGGSHFVLECRFAQRNNDDPIVFPGRPGLSHNHTYIGNFFVDASTTPESLLDGRSSCDFDADSSAYWAPTLLVGLRPVPLITGFVYYVKRTTGPVAPLPAGLKMIAGNSMAIRAQPKRVVSWACGDEVGDAPRFAAIPRCAAKSILEFQVVFPNCWNGTSLDSDNHRRHMAYSTAGSCPASHPVAVPTIILVLLYDKTPQQARLSAGQFALHADFMNGWDQPTLARLVASLN